MISADTRKMEVVITIEKQQPVGEMIKRFIKYRNKTIHEAADAMGIAYNTFSYQLINDKLSVDTLFRLAVYLDIELNWMHMALGYFGPVNPLERENIPRMQRDFREGQRKIVLTRLESLIEENPSSTPDVRRALLSEFNMFFALDVLVPEEYDILMTTERGIAKFYVDTHDSGMRGRNTLGQRSRVSLLKTGVQALDIVIEERKDER